jgi:hypothetical protein
MSNEFIGLALGTVSEKLTPEQTAKANKALQHAQQKHYAKVRKQRSKRK